MFFVAFAIYCGDKGQDVLIPRRCVGHICQGGESSLKEGLKRCTLTHPLAAGCVLTHFSFSNNSLFNVVVLGTPPLSCWLEVMKPLNRLNAPNRYYG